MTLKNNLADNNDELLREFLSTLIFCLLMMCSHKISSTIFQASRKTMCNAFLIKHSYFPRSTSSFERNFTSVFLFLQIPSCLCERAVYTQRSLIYLLLEIYASFGIIFVLFLNFESFESHFCKKKNFFLVKTWKYPPTH